MHGVLVREYIFFSLGCPGSCEIATAQQQQQNQPETIANIDGARAWFWRDRSSLVFLFSRYVTCVVFEHWWERCEKHRGGRTALNFSLLKNGNDKKSHMHCNPVMNGVNFLRGIDIWKLRFCLDGGRGAGAVHLSKDHVLYLRGGLRWLIYDEVIKKKVVRLR